MKIELCEVCMTTIALGGGGVIRAMTSTACNRSWVQSRLEHFFPLFSSPPFFICLLLSFSPSSSSSRFSFIMLAQPLQCSRVILVISPYVIARLVAEIRGMTEVKYVETNQVVRTSQFQCELQVGATWGLVRTTLREWDSNPNDPINDYEYNKNGTLIDQLQYFYLIERNFILI